MTPEEERSGDLLDVALADEIELVSELVVAASSTPRHFTPDEVDALLGIAGEAPGRSSDAHAAPAGVSRTGMSRSDGSRASRPSLTDPAD